MKLLTSTFLATTLLASVAVAQAQTPTPTTTDTMKSESMMTEGHWMKTKGDLIRTRDITGGTIFTLNQADDEGWDMDWTYDQVANDVNEIGSIEDIVLTSDGQFAGIVGEIGGFLDIGDKHVYIKIDDIKLVPVDDQSYAFVTRLNEEELESLPSVDEGFWD